MNEHLTSGLVRIQFRLKATEPWHENVVETLWAEPIGRRNDLYRLMNSPFSVFGVSFQDIVIAYEDDGLLRFQGVASRGGHSTYWLSISSAGPPARVLGYWTLLQGMGCSREKRLEDAWSVDVPPQADIHRVHRLLEEGELAGVWKFKEGHCGHIPAPIVGSQSLF